MRGQSRRKEGGKKCEDNRAYFTFLNVCDRRNTNWMKTLHILQQVALMSKQDFLIGMFFRLSLPLNPLKSGSRDSACYYNAIILICLSPQFSNPSSLKIMYYSDPKRQNNSDFKIIYTTVSAQIKDHS